MTDVHHGEHQVLEPGVYRLEREDGPLFPRPDDPTLWGWLAVFPNGSAAVLWPGHEAKGSGGEGGSFFPGGWAEVDGFYAGLSVSPFEQAWASPPLPWLRPSPDELRRNDMPAELIGTTWLCPVAGCGVIISDDARDRHARFHFPS